MDFPDEYHRILWWLLVATRGGQKRAMIMEILRDNPENINKIAEALKSNYRTAQHHIKVLLDNGIVRKEGDGYGCIYFLSDYYQKNFHMVREIIEEKK